MTRWEKDMLLCGMEVTLKQDIDLTFGDCHDLQDEDSDREKVKPFERAIARFR